MTLPVIQEYRSPGGRRLYGHLHKMETGDLIYIARRRWKEIFKHGRQSIAGAMEDGVACWAIDEMMLIGFRARGVKWIAVNVLDTGDFYITGLMSYFDRTKYVLHDYEGVGRGGSRQRYLPLHFFKHRPGTVKLGVKPKAAA